MTVEGILFDIGGVLQVGASAVPGAVAAVDSARSAGLAIRFVTNTSRCTRAALVDDLRALDINIAPDAVFTAPLAAGSYCEAHGLRPFLLIHPDLEPDLASLDTADPNAVLIGDAGPFFSYERLNTAFRILQAARVPRLIAIARNRCFREADGLSLDLGPFVAALEYAVGVEAVITGKPARAFFEAAVADMQLAPGQVVMIGDDAEADIAGALDAGLQATLVQTGKYQPGDESPLAGREFGLAPDVRAAVAQLSGTGHRHDP